MSLPRVPEEEPARGEDRRAEQPRAPPEERLAEEERQREAEESARDGGQPGRDLVELAARPGRLFLIAPAALVPALPPSGKPLTILEARGGYVLLASDATLPGCAA